MRPALMAAFVLACTVWLSGCVTARYANVTDFNTVVIDAGHGGHDSGAASRGRPRVLEKDLALDVARRLDMRLKDAGFRTVMTRRSDRFIPLDERSRMANAYRKSVFVAIHFNDTRRRSIHGAEVYHNGRGTWELAGRMERYLAAMPGGANRGVRTARYHVLRCAEGPALLVECGYLSNATELAHCASASWREETADRLARAIIAQRRN